MEPSPETQKPELPNKKAISAAFNEGSACNLVDIQYGVETAEKGVRDPMVRAEKVRCALSYVPKMLKHFDAVEGVIEQNKSVSGNMAATIRLYVSQPDLNEFREQLNVIANQIDQNAEYLMQLVPKG